MHGEASLKSDQCMGAEGGMDAAPVQGSAPGPETGAQAKAAASLEAHQPVSLSCTSAWPAPPLGEAGGDWVRPSSADRGQDAVGAGGGDPVLRHGGREEGVQGEAPESTGVALEGRSRGAGAHAAPQDSPAVRPTPGGVEEGQEPSTRDHGEASGAPEAEADAGWTWPAFDYTRPPQCRFLAWEPFRSSSAGLAPGELRASLASGNFPKLVLW